MKSVPSDYYRRLHAIERDHWWRVGMQQIAASLLGLRLRGTNLALLDAGCGTGGYLAWMAETDAFERLVGVDLSPEAIQLAAAAVPGADLRVMGLTSLPFGNAEFDIVTLNDVLQHVHEDAVEASLHELRRVAKPSGALLVRTNGGGNARRERPDWRLYDAQALTVELERSGFHVERVTYANALLSLVGSARGRAPAAPTATSCGIPGSTGMFSDRVGRTMLNLEAWYLRHPQRRLRYGHTLFALATPVGGDRGVTR
jgi:SAM-dependent methyltransferase